MEPADLTLRILQEIRDDIRGVREDLQRSTAESKADIEKFRAESKAAIEQFRAESSARFEILETTLRDLARQTACWTAG